MSPENAADHVELALAGGPSSPCPWRTGAQSSGNGSSWSPLAPALDGRLTANETSALAATRRTFTLAIPAAPGLSPERRSATDTSSPL